VRPSGAGPGDANTRATCVNCRNFRLPCGDGPALFCYEWTDSRPKAIVQIVHGAFEHAGRYAHFARALGARGFAVVAEDHRGHGRTAATADELGHMGPPNAIERVADDVARLTLQSRAAFPGLPAILFGHSLGSLISQRVLAKHGRLYDATVLSGSLSMEDLIQTQPSIDAATSRHGRDTPAEQLHAAFLTELVRDIESPRTRFDWLSRDCGEVDKYICDPLCGFPLTHGAWQDVAEAATLTLDARELRRIPGNLRVLIVSGEADPVHGKGVAIDQLYRACVAAGLFHVSKRLYPGGRHEMLNELNRDAFIQDTIQWMEDALASV